MQHAKDGGARRRGGDSAIRRAPHAHVILDALYWVRDGLRVDLVRSGTQRAALGAVAGHRRGRLPRRSSERAQTRRRVRSATRGRGA